MERLADLNLLRTFVTVAECRSITRAASDLNLPKSTVSRQIAKLEEVRETALFTRGRTGFDLTPFGHRLFEQVRQPILALSERRITENTDRFSGVTRLFAPAVYTKGVLQPVLIDFLAKNPGISVDLIQGDRFTEPDAESIDLIIHVGQSPGKSFEIWSLAPVEARLYASPKLFESAPAPNLPSELQNWSILTNYCSPGANSRLNLYHKGESIVTPTGRARLVSGSPDLLVAAAVRGLGIARLPTFVALPYLKNETLIPVLSEYVLEQHTVTLAKWNRNTNKAARILAQYLVSELG